MNLMERTAALPLGDADLFRQQALIGGAWVEAASGARVAVTNPATGATLGHIPDVSAAETRAAIEAAEAAFGAWRQRTHGERAELLEAWFDLMVAHAEDLAQILTAEQGKPLAEARAEIGYGASFVKWFAEEARRIEGSVIPAPTPDRRIVTLKQPVGVSGIITPWNFPNAMITRKVAPALAAGCTVVIKPSELTPFSALTLGVLAERAGIPAGVINIVTGLPAEIGAELTGNEAVRKISFTGSTRVGSLLMAQSAPGVKRLSLELGGNAPFIVFDDADLDAAVDGVIASKFRNGGQTCVCANRILVQAGVYDAFAEKLAARVRALKVGPGTEEGVDIGPMINEAALEKIDRHVRGCARQGGDAARHRRGAGGPVRHADGADRRHHRDGAGLRGDLRPGRAALPLRDRGGGDRHRQRHPFGLAAYFYTESLSRAWRVSEALEFGMVGLNVGAISTAVAPFGGVKQSGLGREGARVGIEEYLETKALHIGGL
jgi:succinate-semialdehyde dehydrogenase / glutarate-semialdehyde dehydrogenase